MYVRGNETVFDYFFLHEKTSFFLKVITHFSSCFINSFESDYSNILLHQWPVFEMFLKEIEMSFQFK